MKSEITFAPLQAGHLPDAVRMSAELGWPHRLEDWAFVAEISKGVVALREGRVVATALATPFGPVAMANLIIVDPSCRGRGLGREIISRAMQTVSPQAWQLVATKDGLPLYEKLGFRGTDEILQLQGQVSRDHGAIASTEGVGWATAADLAEIQRLDSCAKGIERTSLYQILRQESQFVVLRQDGAITGFAALRHFGRGQLAGPIVAPSLDKAQSLLSLILAECDGQFLRVDTHADTGLAPWLAKHGLNHVGGGLHMQKGELSRDPSPFTVFALASQALG